MKITGYFYVLCVIVAQFLTGIASSQDEMQFPVQEFKLDNGMTFLVVERHTTPVFSICISVGAGSAHEKIGNIGTAHLLEHMMSKGSRSIGTTDYESERELMAKEDSIWVRIDQANQQTKYVKLNHPDRLQEHLHYIADLKTILDSLAQASSQYVVQNEFDRIYTRNGAAQFNARTGYDDTYYIVSLPANRLELCFAMESDRLRNPVFREFFPERDVVSEERRLKVENSSEAKLFEQLIGTAFIAHPYQLFWEWQSEINSLARTDLQEFFDSYYIPQRISVAVVGDVKLEEVKRLAENYFGDVPRGKNPDPIYTVEPEQPGERRVEVVYDANPMISIAYHKTAFDSPDEPAFSIIERLLGEGRTSRLFKSLVLEKQLCFDVYVYTFPGGRLGDAHPGVFCIDAYPKEGISTAEVEEAIYKELEELSTTPVEDRELTKTKNNIDADFVWASYTNMGLAGYLAKAANLTHDWKYLLKLRSNLKAVTPDDILKTAQKYFTKDNRTVAVLIPREKGETP